MSEKIRFVLLGICLTLMACQPNAKDQHLTGGPNVDSLILSNILMAEQEAKENNDLTKTIKLLLSTKSHPQFHYANDPTRSLLYHKLGVNYYRNMQGERAVLYLDTAIILRSKNVIESTNLDLANSYYLRSLSYEIQYKYNEAIKDVFEAVRAVDNFPAEKFKKGSYYSKLARLFYSVGEYEKAREYFDQAVPFIEPISNEMADHYNSYALFLKRIGLYEKAINNFEKSLKIYAQLPDDEFYSPRVKFNLLDVLNRNKSYAVTKQSLVSFLSGFDASTSPLMDLKRQCYNNLALLDIKNKNYKEAYKNYSQVLKFAKQLSFSDQTVSIARGYEGLGDVLAYDKKYDAAIAQYHLAIQALCIGFETDDIYALPVLKEHVVINRAELERILGFKADAIFAKYKTTGKLADLEAIHQTYLELDHLLVEIRQGYMAAMSRSDLVRRTLPYYEKATQVALQLYQRTQRNEYLEAAYSFASKNKAVIMLDGLQAEKAGFAGIPSDILKTERDLKSEIYKLDSDIYDLNNQEKKSKKKLDQLVNLRFKKTRAYEDLISQLEKDYPKYHELKYANRSSVDVKSIRNQLPDDVAVIEYFVGRDSIYTFSYSKGENIKCLVKEKTEDFGENCLTFRRMSEKDSLISIAGFSNASHALYQLLLKETVANFETASKVKRLFIIPDDHLMQISFDALFTNPIDTTAKLEWTNDLPFLLKDYAISYAYSNQLLFDKNASNRVRSAVEKYVGFGLEYDDYTLEAIEKLQSIKIDESLTRGMGRLIYSDDEVKESAKIFNGKSFLNKKATKSKFKKVASSAHILHLVTHGYVVKDHPLNSGLFFTKQHERDDFILKASDLYSIKLNAQIAVLSACHTGDGKLQRGEGVRSLARAFNYAGCPNVTASLWGAPDLSTKKIIVSFYQYIKDGATLDIALQKAKLDYMDNCIFNKNALPRNWAHLVTIGDVTEMY